MSYIFERNWKKSDLLRHVGNMDQLAGIRISELLDGKGKGCRVLDVWTGTGLRFQVNADRALDINSCDYRGYSICWRSAAGDVNPAFYEPHNIGWLRSFSGGLLTTCGLDQFGSPCEDNGSHFGLHGRISNLPAAKVSSNTYWDGDDYLLEISGEVRQSALFAENLVLKRKIKTALGSNRIHIEDKVTNEGYAPSPHMQLYHFNFGFPLIAEDTQLKLHSDKVLPRDEDANAGITNWNKFQNPTPGFKEQVFIHNPVADERGLSSVEIVNPAMKLSLRVTFSPLQLPYLMEWKMMGEGNYVVGIEPANCNGLGGRVSTREKGDLPILEPGESCEYSVDLEIVSNQ